jgi:hypothetical protein
VKQGGPGKGEQMFCPGANEQMFGYVLQKNRPRGRLGLDVH